MKDRWKACTIVSELLWIWTSFFYSPIPNHHCLLLQHWDGTLSLTRTGIDKSISNSLISASIPFSKIHPWRLTLLQNRPQRNWMLERTHSRHDQKHHQRFDTEMVSLSIYLDKGRSLMVMLMNNSSSSSRIFSVFMINNSRFTEQVKLKSILLRNPADCSAPQTIKMYTLSPLYIC